LVRVAYVTLTSRVEIATYLLKFLSVGDCCLTLASKCIHTPKHGPTQLIQLHV